MSFFFLEVAQSLSNAYQSTVDKGNGKMIRFFLNRKYSRTKSILEL